MNEADHSNTIGKDVIEPKPDIVFVLLVIIMATLCIFSKVFTVSLPPLFELNTHFIKLTLHVTRNTHRLCTNCACGALKRVTEKYDYTLFPKTKGRTRVRLLNRYIEKPATRPDIPEQVHDLEIHDCGGLESITFEMASTFSRPRLLFLPSSHYYNFLVEDLNFVSTKGSKLPDLPPSYFSRRVYAARGRIVIGENCSYVESKHRRARLVALHN